MFEWLREFYKEEAIVFVICMFVIVSMALLLAFITNGLALVFFGVVGAIVYGIIWLIQLGEEEDL